MRCEEYGRTCLVLDLLMPGASGLELLRALNDDDATRQTRVVLLTAVADDDQLLEAIRLGAQGVVLKEMAPQLLLDAVREVHAGAQWLKKAWAAGRCAVCWRVKRSPVNPHGS